MSYLLLHAGRLTTLLAEDPIVPARDVGALVDTTQLLETAERIRSEEAEQGRNEGHAQGLAEGRATAEAELRAELFRLAVRDAGERQKLREDVATLAIEVVRRIAGALGPETVVAALAERAVAELVPDTVATMRVAPANVDAVSERLAKLPGIRVSPDAELGADDCIVETALGRVHAGLETQLAAIAHTWETEVADAA